MKFSTRVNDFIKKLDLSEEEIDNYIKFAYPIIMHDEFQKRLTKEFLHHDDITLGEHILMVSLKTYQMALNEKRKNNLDSFDIKTATLIALFHDCYTLPWQNNPNNASKKIYNKHGFRHPVEALINVVNWYPEYFNDPIVNKKIVDGILHHMYPFPVRAVDGSDMELKNNDLYQKLPINIKNDMIISTSKGKIGKYSFAFSEYKEGKLVNAADKLVSMKLDIKNLNSLTALVTGYNKNLVYKK